MTFKELEKKVGKTLAIIIDWQNTPQEVLDNLTLAECFDVIEQCVDENIEQKIIEKALDLAQTIEDCLSILEISSFEMNNKIIRKAYSIANSLVGYLKVFEITSFENPIRKKALQKAQDLIVTIEDAILVFEQTHLYPELKSFEAVLKLVKTFEDAVLAYESTFPLSENRKLVFAKMLEMAKTTTECIQVYKKTDDQESALTKAFNLANSFSDYFQVYRQAKTNSDLKKQAFRKTLETASSPAECIELKIQSSHDKERKQALTKAISIANTIEGHLSVYYALSTGEEKKTAINTALDLAKTIEDCLVIYNSCDQGEPRQKALEKMQQIKLETQ